MEWVEITAKTVDEAQELALDQLGVDEQDAEFEVLEEPKAGFFGRSAPRPGSGPGWRPTRCGPRSNGAPAAAGRKDRTDDRRRRAGPGAGGPPMLRPLPAPPPAPAAGTPGSQDGAGGGRAIGGTRHERRP